MAKKNIAKRKLAVKYGPRKRTTCSVQFFSWIQSIRKFILGKTPQNAKIVIEPIAEKKLPVFQPEQYDYYAVQTELQPAYQFQSPNLIPETTVQEKIYEKQTPVSIDASNKSAQQEPSKRCDSGTSKETSQKSETLRNKSIQTKREKETVQIWKLNPGPPLQRDGLRIGS